MTVILVILAFLALRLLEVPIGLAYGFIDRTLWIAGTAGFALDLCAWVYILFPGVRSWL